jgi:N-methylhydantoinase A
MSSFSKKRADRGMLGIVTLTRMVEARYAYQEHSVVFECPLGVKATEIATRMHAAHKTAFTFDLPDAAAELTSVHLQAEAPVETFPLSRLETAPNRPIVPDRRRRILLSSADAWIYCEV